MMIDMLPAALLAALAGAGVGALFVPWLRLDAERMAGAARPMLGLLLGGAARVASVTAALWLIGGGEPVRLLAALAGFSLARLLAARRLAAGAAR